MDGSFSSMIFSLYLIDFSQILKFADLHLKFDRIKDFLTLIKSPPFVEVQSIIIYCKFQVFMLFFIFQMLFDSFLMLC